MIAGKKCPRETRQAERKRLERARSDGLKPDAVSVICPDDKSAHFVYASILPVEKNRKKSKSEGGDYEK